MTNTCRWPLHEVAVFSVPILIPILGLLASGCVVGELSLDGPDDARDGDDDVTSDDDVADDDVADDDAETENQPPTAVINGPATGWVGVAVQLDGWDSSDPDGDEIVAYAWTSSDGQSGDDVTFAPAFDAPGTIQVTLTVEDARGGVGETTTELTISEADEALWTVLVYVNADNNLDSYGVEDVNEMEVIGSTPEVNVVVQLDRYSTGAWSEARRYLVQQDASTSEIGSPILSSLGEVDMGDPQVAVDFVTWGISAYPAQRYAVVFWDHGDGWSFAPGPGTDQPLLKGFSSDSTSNSSISVAGGQLEAILTEITATIGRPIDLLGFDACLMQMWEVGYVASPYADAMVGSEDSEGSDGWDYTAWLAELVADPTMDGGELGAAIARAYVNSGSSWECPTQSVVDLTAYAGLTDAVDRLAGAVIDHPESVDDVVDAARSTTYYSWMPHRDLREFADALTGIDEPDIADAAVDLRDAVDGAVIEAQAQGIVGNGIAIYLTATTSGWAGYDSDYHTGAGTTWAADTRWDEMLQSF